MRKNVASNRGEPRPARTVRTRKARLKAAAAAGLLASCAALALAVQGYNRAEVSAPAAGLKLLAQPLPQSGPPARSPHGSRLALHPQADRLRRSLGRRFMAAGREVSVLVGTLSLEGSARRVRITRIQGDDGEQVAITLEGEAEPLTWSAAEGARASGRPAEVGLRLMVERIALDSAEQFVLAQLRGASYSTIAASAMPSEAAGDEHYSGPVWDIVRVAEPTQAAQDGVEDTARLYYINTSTGLIDKVSSQQQGQLTLAEFTGWAERGGELLPARVRWSRNGQAVMELTIEQVSYGPRR